VKIPALPTLSDDQPAKGTNAAPVSATNTAAAKGTNKTQIASATNSVSASTSVAGTNSAVAGTSTNSAPGTQSAKSETVKTEVNLPAQARSNLEQGTVTVSVASLSEKGSNAVRTLAGTNDQPMITAAGTNAAARGSGADKGTNAASARDVTVANASSRAASPKKTTDLPPEIKARVDRIVESEILGQVIRPMPMALIGIAGNSALIRTPNGQTGFVKEGDEFGGIKLLQIGINRVLVEEQGQKKELTIFSGFGSESLLAKPKETSDETTHK
jgi:hypothetical protein